MPDSMREFRQGSCAAPGIAHSLPAGRLHKDNWGEGGEDVYAVSYRVGAGYSNWGGEAFTTKDTKVHEGKTSPQRDWGLQSRIRDTEQFPRLRLTSDSESN